MYVYVCLVESETSGTVRFQIFGDNSASPNYVVPGGPVPDKIYWKVFSRFGRDHFLCITNGLSNFCTI